MIPPLVITPFAGVAVDRYDRRKLMMASCMFSACCSTWLVILAGKEIITVPSIVILLSLTVSSNTFNMLAYYASISSLVEGEHLGRANAISETGSAIASVIAPLLGGFLVLTIGLKAVLTIDLCSYAIGAATAFGSFIPRFSISAEPPQKSSLATDLLIGVRTLRQHGDLLRLTLYFTLVNVATTFANVVRLPLFLSFTSAAGLGRLLSIESAGFLIGALVMTVWGGPKRQMLGILFGGAAQAAGMFLIGIRPSMLLAAIGLFVSAPLMPIMNACYRALLQQRFAAEIQGRVFSSALLIIQCLGPIAVLAAGPISDNVFKPSLLPNGILASTVGQWFGVGEGRGLGLLLAIIGIGIALATAAMIFPANRLVEFLLGRSENTRREKHQLTKVDKRQFEAEAER
jgi:MFS transporter, DHA3 family, macrolide efflux protein